MSPANSSTHHFRALITAILTVVALVATSATKAPTARGANDAAPAIPLETLREAIIASQTMQ